MAEVKSLTIEEAQSVLSRAARNSGASMASA